MRRQMPIIRNGIVAAVNGEESKAGRGPVRVESAEWFAWLETVKSFAIDDPSGRVMVRKERRANGWYWYAYYRQAGIPRRSYLGKSTNMTNKRLHAATESLVGADPPLPMSSIITTALALQEKQPTTPTLLMTKFVIPPLRTSLLILPHAFDRLQQVIDYPLTLLSAPAGFGKTTIVAQWARMAGVPVGWVSLDTNDNDPVRFWSYLSAAFARIIPDLAHYIARVDEARPAQVLLTALINALTTVTTPIVVVIDDYDAIDETSTLIHEELAYLLEFLPSQVHLIIASRSVCRLPIASLRGHGLLNELSAGDLWITPEEGALLLACRGIALAPADLAALDRQIAGWVAGWQLAGASLEGCDEPSRWIDDFDGSHRYVTDFLTTEVLKHLPPSVLAFLLQTSLLDRLTAPLCDAVMATSGSQATLEWLERTNLFVQPQDEQRQCYRYHPLFATALRQRLHQTHANCVPSLYKRASAWCRDNDHIAEAVEYARKSEDMVYLADVIEAVVADMLERDELTSLEGWLAALPDKILRTRPQLCICKAHLLLLKGPTEDIERYVHYAEMHIGRIPSSERQALQREIIIVRATVVALQDVAHMHDKHPTNFLTQLTASPPMRESIIEYLGAEIAENADLANVGAVLQNVRQQDETLDSTHLHSVSINYLILVRFLEGKLGEVIHLALSAHRMVKRSSRVGTYIALGLALYERNELAGAADALYRCIKLGYSQASVAAAMSVLALVEQAQGQTHQANTLMARAYATKATDTDWMTLLIMGSQVRLWQLQEDDAAIIAWGTTFERGNVFQDASHMAVTDLDSERLWLARIALAQGNASQALPDIAYLLEAMQASGRMLGIVEVLIMQALAYAALHDETAALDSLQQALKAAESERYMRLFVDGGTRVRHLLKRLQARPHTASNFGKQVLAAFAPTLTRAAAVSTRRAPTAASPKQPYHEALSERELEVLNLVAGGASNNMLAQKLVIAEGTVKRHLSNIFLKLDAKNRIQAVNKAKERHLIDDYDNLG